MAPPRPRPPPAPAPAGVRAAVAGLALLALLVLAAGAARAEARVDVVDRAFSPATARVSPYETVVWRWVEGRHGVAPDEGGEAWCEPRAEGACRRVFEEVGTYPYHCPLHPEMTGVVEVARRGGDAAAPLRALFDVEVDGLRVRVDAGRSAQSSTAIERYTWSWGDGSPDSHGRVAEHTYAAQGRYAIRLRVLDEDGRHAVSSRDVAVAPPEPPVAAFSARAQGLVVTFEAREAGGEVARRTWDFGDGERLECAPACQALTPTTRTTPSGALEHAYRRGGTFVVNHTVVLADGSSRSQEASVAVPAIEGFSTQAEGLLLRADASALARYGNATFRWRFGDTTSAEGERVEHRFPQPGLWDVELVVTDEAGTFTLVRTVALAEAPASPERQEATPSGAPPREPAKPAPGPAVAVVAAALAVAAYSWRWRT